MANDKSLFEKISMIIFAVILFRVTKRTATKIFQNSTKTKYKPMPIWWLILVPALFGLVAHICGAWDFHDFGDDFVAIVVGIIYIIFIAPLFFVKSREWFGENDKIKK